MKNRNNKITTIINVNNIPHLLEIPPRLEFCSEVPEELTVRPRVEWIQLCERQQFHFDIIVGERGIPWTHTVLHERFTTYMEIGKPRKGKTVKNQIIEKKEIENEEEQEKLIEKANVKESLVETNRKWREKYWETVNAINNNLITSAVWILDSFTGIWGSA